MKFNEYFKLKDMTINITNACNMKSLMGSYCSYCFEANRDNNLMTKDDIKVILDKAYKNFLDNNDNKGSFFVSFFGGEPFINFDVIEFALKYSREMNYNIEFGVTTNMTILTDHMIDIIEDYELGILVSIDGIKEIHDRNRSNSYDIVKNNVKRLIDRHLGYLLEARMTAMPKDCDKLLESIQSIIDMGIVNIAPVPVTDTLWYDDDIETLRTNLSRVWEWLFEVYNDNENKKNVSIKFIEDYMEKVLTMDTIPNQTKLCSAGSSLSCSIGCNGDILPCHQRHTIKKDYEKLVMGNILQDTDIKSVEFNDMTRHSLWDCNRCIAKNICKGGCPSENLTLNGCGNRLNCNQCRIYKTMCEVAINFQNDLMKCSNIRSHRLNVLAENLKVLEIFKNEVLPVDKTSKEYVIKLHEFYETLMSKKDILLPLFEETISMKIKELVNINNDLKKGK